MGNLDSHGVWEQLISNMAFLQDVVGGLEQEANAVVGFPLFDREGWSQKFPQEKMGREGQDLFSYTFCSGHYFHLCNKPSGFTLTY